MPGQWNDQFESLVRAVVPALQPQAPITADLDLPAAGLTSIGIVQLLVQIQREYAIELSFEMLSFSAFNTPGSIWDAILAARGEGPENGEFPG